MSSSDSSSSSSSSSESEVEIEPTPMPTETEVESSELPESAMQSTASVASVRGGVKVSKKPKYDPLYLQRIIDKELRERISIDAFKQDKIVTMVKNTVGIKCKQCGSDNVYVESKQVRSADEAMTKFYTCLNCGNKWRFD